MIGVGLFLYDLLSAFKNKPHQLIRAKKTLQRLTGLKAKGLKGSGIYHDSIVDDAKLGLDCLYDAVHTGNTDCSNYTEVMQVDRTNKRVTILLKDVIKGETKSISCDELVFATGPFTDELLPKLNIPWRSRMLLSRGSHLWLKPNSLKCEHSIVLQTNDKRIIFVIPQERGILVGTTEVKVSSMQDNQISEDEIKYLLSCVNEYFPGSNITREHILSTFSGVRPLVKEESSMDQNKTSRVHKIYHPYSNMHVILGGKYTTFRTMAFDICALVCKRMGIKHRPSLTTQPLAVTSFYKFYKELKLDEDSLNMS
jgi:glycerol-3-phosphate dehydrogenase